MSAQGGLCPLCAVLTNERTGRFMPVVRGSIGAIVGELHVDPKILAL
jgi:hypothetical protein